MNFKLKYEKYKQIYLNLKKQYGGGNKFIITDDNLEYYHKKHLEFNSSITIYGEYHALEYNEFLSKHIDYLYSTDKRQIIILEKNNLELMSEERMFRMMMQEHPEQDKNIMRKKIVINSAPTPILYFSGVYKHDGNFPNTEIICGDIRLKRIFNLIIELNDISKLNPEDIINIEFLTNFKDAWEEQLSILTGPEYLEIKNEANALLLEILPTMTNNEVSEISNMLNQKWIYLSNISMLQYIIQHIIDGVDITLFIGALHMPHLIDEIEKLYPSLIDASIISDNSVQIPELDNQDDDLDNQDDDLDNEDDVLDTDPNYADFQFVGKERLKGYEIKPDIYYSIRLKHSGSCSVRAKLKGYEGEKIILEPDDFIQEQTNIKFDINSIYAYIN